MRSLMKFFCGAVPRDGGSGAGGLLMGAAGISTEVRDAIEAAHLTPREPNDDGARTVVQSHALRGMFVYSREEAERRVRLAFPELTGDHVARAVRHLESRVRLREQPWPEARRKDWVHGWREG